MGVSGLGGGGGRRKNVNAELNLVPFIDMLSTNITFLIATAVWIEISNMPLDQAVSDPNAQPVIQDPPPPPPLTVHIRADGVWVGRKIDEGANFPAISDDNYDWFAVDKEVAMDREKFPTEDQVVIMTDDGVEYGWMIKALDITRKYNYEKSLLAGGPAAVAALPPPGAR